MLPLKRGRPSQSAKSEWNVKPSSEMDPFLDSRKAYERNKALYLQSGYSQRLRIMIRQVLKLLKFPSSITREPVLDIFEVTVKKLLISEIELLGFFVLFKKLDKSVRLDPIEELIKLIFFKSKTLLEQDQSLMSFLFHSLKTEIKSFEVKFNSIKNLPDLTTKEILQTYHLLTERKITQINYNFYADEILRNSPPYKLTKKIFTITRRVKDPQNNQEVKNVVKFQDDDENLYNEKLLDDGKNEYQGLELCNLMPINKKESGYFHEEYDNIDRFASTSDCLSVMSPRLEENDEDLIII